MIFISRARAPVCVCGGGWVFSYLIFVGFISRINHISRFYNISLCPTVIIKYCFNNCPKITSVLNNLTKFQPELNNGWNHHSGVNSCITVSGSGQLQADDKDAYFIDFFLNKIGPWLATVIQILINWLMNLVCSCIKINNTEHNVRIFPLWFVRACFTVCFSKYYTVHDTYCLLISRFFMLFTRILMCICKFAVSTYIYSMNAVKL